MKNPAKIKQIKLGSVVSATNIRNPLLNGKRSKNVLSKHKELFEKTGVKYPKSPLV